MSKNVTDWLTDWVTNYCKCSSCCSQLKMSRVVIWVSLPDSDSQWLMTELCRPVPGETPASSSAALPTTSLSLLCLSNCSVCCPPPNPGTSQVKTDAILKLHTLAPQHTTYQTWITPLFATGTFFIYPPSSPVGETVRVSLLATFEPSNQKKWYKKWI